METKILKTLNSKMTLLELANKMRFSEYTREVFWALDELVKQGKIERTWDESGMCFYQKK